MFQSLSDPGKPAPMCGIIASHLQLIYLLKKILNRSLVCDLIWDAKEGVPFSFNRYGDGQFKEFSRSQFEEVTGLVRQLVLYAVPKVQGLEENLEYLRLSMSAKLLTCSQLQANISLYSLIMHFLSNSFIGFIYILFIYLLIYLLIYLFIYFFIDILTNLSIYLFTCPLVYLFTNIPSTFSILFVYRNDISDYLC